MNECTSCRLIAEKDKSIYVTEPSGLFVAMWTSLPASPGHTLVIPQRHIQRFREMNEAEMRGIASFVASVKSTIEETKLRPICDGLEIISDESKERVAKALEMLRANGDRRAEAFNDGINDGDAAGQETPHLHWHILPRWRNSDGDIVDLFAKTGTL
jgi:diadenosine tetraphosphate (Ap4A) HIT family hydrolase